MPKNTRKKKLKAEDFKKQKLKVGKKKLVADNATSTSFKSQAIVLPGQSLTVDKSHQATNSRNQSLGSLTAQLKHYSASTRRDALNGLCELFRMHPGLLATSLSSIVNIMASLLVDEDNQVRKALYSLLEEFLPTLDKTNLAPFLPVLVVYTRSAMTHLNETIQAGSLLFLDLWIKLAPEFVVVQQPLLIPNYIGLLSGNQNHGNISTSSISAYNTAGSARNSVFINPKSTVGSQKLRIDVLGSLCRFLEASTKITASKLAYDPYWFFNNYLYQPLSRSYVASVPSPCLSWSSPASHTLSALLNAPETLLYAHNEVAGTAAKQFNPFTPSTNMNDTDRSDNAMNVTELLNLLDALRPALLAIWLESAPSVFTAHGDILSNDSLGTVYLILRILRTLWRAAFGRQISIQITASWIDSNMKSLLQHFTLYFPYGQDMHKIIDKKTESTLQDMNAAFCELTSLYLMAQDQNMHQDSALNHQAPPWTGQVVDYVLEVFDWHTTAAKSANKSDNMVHSIPPEQLAAMMPSVWTLMNCLEASEQAILFQAICAYGERCHATSPSRRLCVEFIAHLTKTECHSQYKGTFRIKPRSIEAVALERWLLSLPKMLWNLKTLHPETTEVVLDALNDAVKRQCKRSSLDNQFLKQLQMNLIPFFHVTLPGKGPIFGPFVSLPSQIQRKAIELLYYLSQLNERLQAAVITCKDDKRLSEEIRNYLCASLPPVIDF
ncbi:hypothetical protein BDF19DRAFT_442172 [Syncephalis fuscata]|nr:hypothetical protein BDF19DRAFT_442172 [Syncephalis fuscata]